MPRLNEKTGKKQCSRCKVDKPISEYSFSVGHGDGYYSLCKVCISESNRVAYANGKNRTKKRDWRKARGYNLKTKYGLTHDTLAAILQVQGGVCAVCGTGEPKPTKVNPSGWCIDHNHTTGEIRGILCGTCNFLLGHAKEDTKTLAAAIEYLNKAASGSSPAAVALAQISEADNCTTEAANRELESWLLGEATP